MLGTPPYAYMVVLSQKNLPSYFHTLSDGLGESKEWKTLLPRRPLTGKEVLRSSQYSFCSRFSLSSKDRQAISRVLDEPVAEVSPPSNVYCPPPKNNLFPTIAALKQRCQLLGVIESMGFEVRPLGVIAEHKSPVTRGNSCFLCENCSTPTAAQSVAIDHERSQITL